MAGERNWGIANPGGGIAGIPGVMRPGWPMAVGVIVGTAAMGCMGIVGITVGIVGTVGRRGKVVAPTPPSLDKPKA